MVEVLKDVAFRVLPISYNSAKKMIQEIRSYPILKGARGNPPGDERAINRLLLTCSEVIESYPEIREMDLNPVIVYETGIRIVDARIILG
jgi:acetyltransferase